MGKRRAISLLVCFTLLLWLICPVFAEETTSATEPKAQINPANTDASVSNGCHTADAQVPLRSDHVLDTGKAALLYEVNSGTLVYGENIDMRMSPGSFVKLMTALLAIEQGDLNQQITISQETLDRIPWGSSAQGFLAGEVLTLEQLLYSLIVRSANDAAAAIAEYIAGTQEAFVDAMNQKAAQIGCTNTHYTNVHGISDDEQYTTPRDLAKLMAYGMQYEMFQTLLGTAKYILPATNLSEERRLDTTNFMISELVIGGYYDGRVTGGKISASDDGRRSLIVTAQSGGLRYVGIVVETEPEYGSDGYSIRYYREFIEMENVLDLGFDNYEVKQIFYAGQITGQFAVANGENSVAVGPTKSVATVLPKDVGLDDLSLRFQKAGETLTAPVEKGQNLDILQVWYGSVCIAQSELVAMNSSAVAAITPMEPAASPGAGTEGLIKVLVILGIVLCVIIVFVVVLYIVRIIRRVLFQAKRRRRRNSRRRSR